MTYKYIAYTSEKKVVRGTLDVATENLAEDVLYRAGYEQILSLQEVPPGFSLERLVPSLFGVKKQDVIDFANQLATLVESGITVLMSLELLAGQSYKKTFKKIITGLAGEIQGGGSLSQTLGRYPHVFPDTYLQVIKASEQTGNLEMGLRHAAGYTEKQAAANQKVKRAMAYPIFVLLMAIGVCVMLVTIALPPMMDLFKSLGAELPWMTQLLISVTDFILNNRLTILAGIVIIIMLIIFIFRQPSVKIARDRYILRIPVLGTIILERSMQHFCHTASMLLKAGLRLPQIMEIVIHANRNQTIHDAMCQVRDKLVQGEGLSKPMEEAGLFPPLLVEMTAVGEKSGTMDSTLATLADFYEKKVDRNIDILITMIEPTLTLLVGGIVIFIALSIITPLYSIMKSLR